MHLWRACASCDSNFDTVDNREGHRPVEGLIPLVDVASSVGDSVVSVQEVR